MSFEVFAVLLVVGYCSTIRLVPLWGRKQWTLQRKSIVVGKFLITKSVTGHEKNKEKSVVGHIDENYQFMTNNTADWKRPTTVALHIGWNQNPPERIIVWNCRWWLLLKMRAKNEHKKIKKFDFNYHSSYQNLNTFYNSKWNSKTLFTLQIFRKLVNSTLTWQRFKFTSYFSVFCNSSENSSIHSWQHFNFTSYFSESK